MISAKVTVNTTDTLKKVKKTLERIKGSYVTVGVHEDAGEYEDGTSVAEVALWNEFGTERIPERSFIRSTLHENMSRINGWRQDLLSDVIEDKITLEHALDVLGFRMRELVRAKINSNIPPPNAPSTVAHKRLEGVPPRTLVETGLLARSVEYKVVIGGGGGEE